MTLAELRAEAEAKATKHAQDVAERRIVAAAKRDQRDQAREIVRDGGASGFRDAMRQVTKASPRVEITEIGNTDLPEPPQGASKAGDDDPSETTVDLTLCNGSVVRVTGKIISGPT